MYNALTIKRSCRSQLRDQAVSIGIWVSKMITLTDAFNPQNATGTVTPLQEDLRFEKPITRVLVVLPLQAVVYGGWIWPL